MLVRLIEGDASGNGQSNESAGQQNCAGIAHQEILAGDNELRVAERGKTPSSPKTGLRAAHSFTIEGE